MWEMLDLRKKILLAIGGLVFCFLLYYFVLGPQIRAYAETRTKLAEVQSKLVKARAVLYSQRKEEMLAREAARRLEEVAPYFSVEMQDGSALVLIGLKAIQNKINITSFGYSPILNKDFYLELPVKFTVKGQYSNFISFIHDMEYLPNLTAVRTLNIKLLDNNQEGIVEATFDLILYSDSSPKTRVGLVEMAKWAFGRYNAFKPTSIVSPLPGVVVPVEKFTTPGIKGEQQEAERIISESEGLFNGAQVSPGAYPKVVGKSVYSTGKIIPEVEPEIPFLK